MCGACDPTRLTRPHLRGAITALGHRIARRLTTDESGALDPDLARVLRRVVFRKDARWVELEIAVPAETKPAETKPAEKPAQKPAQKPADEPTRKF